MTGKMKHGAGGGRTRFISLMLVFFVSRAAVHGRLNVNVALNRPTFAISEFYDQFGTYSSWKAVDGNNDVDAEKPDNSCFHSEWEDNPWMAVDLGAALAVVGVLFTNREGDHAEYADNFIVGLTDVSPAITAPTLWNYDVCGQYPGVVGDGATVYLTCTSCVPPRRYLIVQIEHGGFLIICDIEVYAHSLYWKESRGKRMLSKVVSTFQVDRRVNCMANCSLSSVCDSYNYRAADKTCQFNTHDTPHTANSTDIVDDSAWSWWSSSFTQLL